MLRQMVITEDPRYVRTRCKGCGVPIYVLKKTFARYGDGAYCQNPCRVPKKRTKKDKS